MEQQMITNMPISVTGHVHIQDDLGHVHLDKFNAVHPQNMARIIARALANESNSHIYRMAFGNGGTDVSVANVITYRPPNDGQPPDIFTWDSRLYNETFSKIIDTNSPVFGTDPGSADINTGTRPGGGALPYLPSDYVAHVSGPGVRSRDLGLTSEVVIQVLLKAGEPLSQKATDSSITDQNANESFIFDELGLYTPGAQAIDTSGYQSINVGDNRTVDDVCGLLPSTNYCFDVSIDGGVVVTILLTTPAVGSGPSGAITYGDLCQTVNTSGPGNTSLLPGGALMTMTNYDNAGYSSVPPGTQTFGFLNVESQTVGATSTVSLSETTSIPPGYTSMLRTTAPVLNPSQGGPIIIIPASDGTVAGVQNDPVNPPRERERLLTHLIFSPIEKAANRSFVITYTLTVSVARTPSTTP